MGRAGDDRLRTVETIRRQDGRIWPESTKYIDEQFAGLTPDQIHKITCENAAKFYRLSN